MQTRDSSNLRDCLKRLLPGLKIEETKKQSGQRVVYFCSFYGSSAAQEKISWGPVVLKVTEQLSSKQIAYLQKEIEILNDLDSKYYPKLHYNDVFYDDPDTEIKFRNPLFVTLEERIDAKPLSERLKRFSNEKSVVELLIKLVEALCLLWNHKKRIVHRDIKPDNILVKNDNEIAIIDLGIIREEGTTGLTDSLIPWGPCSPPYASPEQAKNDKKNISFKSDLFSLGTLAYELITGQNPYFRPNQSNEETLENILNLRPEPLERIDKSSKEFSDLVEKLMEKEPYKRYRTIESFRMDLQAIKESLE